MFLIDIHTKIRETRKAWTLGIHPWNFVQDSPSWKFEFLNAYINIDQCGKSDKPLETERRKCVKNIKERASKTISHIVNIPGQA